MAKRKTKAKRYAVQRHIEIEGMNNQNVNMIDVPMCLSETNHRLYRQSRVYRAKVSSTESIPRTGFKYNVYVLRDTWMMQKAYQLAKDTFDKNMTEERADISTTNMARWQDFRINLNPKSSGVVLASPIIRSNGTFGATTLGNGEFELSKVYAENGTSYTFGFYGDASQWSIVEQYDRTADVDSKPSNTVSGADINPYGALDDDNQQAARNDLQNLGNQPPYDRDSLDGDKLFRRVATLGATNDGTSKTTTGFFDAPLGLILIETVGDQASTNYQLELEVQSGDYKGIHGSDYIDIKKFGHRRA